MTHDEAIKLLLELSEAFPVLLADEPLVELLALLKQSRSTQVAFDEWIDKTEWVQKSPAGCGELGKHRADIMRQRLELSEASRRTYYMRMLELEAAASDAVGLIAAGPEGHRAQRRLKQAIEGRRLNSVVQVEEIDLTKDANGRYVQCDVVQSVELPVEHFAREFWTRNADGSVTFERLPDKHVPDWVLEQTSRWLKP